MAINQKHRAQRAWRILAKLASNKKPPLAYGEICEALGYHWRAAQWFLGVIQTYCHENGLPPLQTLAVNKRSRLPGSGYDGSPQTPAEHQKALRAVYKQAWPAKAPF